MIKTFRNLFKQDTAIPALKDGPASVVADIFTVIVSYLQICYN